MPQPDPTSSTPSTASAETAHVAPRPAQDDVCPTGRLRFGVVVAPERTSLFVTVDAAGAPQGVTVALAGHLAKHLGVPVDYVVLPNSGELVEGLAYGSIDAAFMPVDDERRAKVAFGPAYTSAENTYLVRAGAGIRSLAEVDRSGVRVVGIANTTTIRSAAGLLKNVQIEPIASVAEAMDHLRHGRADAFALTRDALVQLLPGLPGASILGETFRLVSIAVAVLKDCPQALARVAAWLADAKRAGVVRRLLDAAGLPDVPVAA
jgi:polar amino acid transport system substrate-binding protein